MDVTAADLDGDGDLDLVAPLFDSDELAVFLQDGSGFVDLMEPDTTIDVSVEPTAVVAGDLDGDGDLDLLSANARDPSVSVLLRKLAGGLHCGLDDGEHDGFADRGAGGGPRPRW